jgi:hypothetical protein
MAHKQPESQEAKDLYQELKDFIAKAKNAGKVKKAERIILELEAGFGSESMFISTAKVFLGKKLAD